MPRNVISRYNNLERWTDQNAAITYLLEENERLRTDVNRALGSARKSYFGNYPTNYAIFEDDGTLAFYGNATVFDDLYFPMSSGKIGGANQPAWAAFQGNTYEYAFGVNDYIHLPGGEVTHKYREGSSLEFHVHIVTNGLDATARDVNYEIEYTIGDMDEVMSAAATITSGDYTIPANTTDRTHLYINVDTVAFANMQIGAALKMRFRRIALTGGGSAPSNDPFVVMVGIHMECDTVGSRTAAAK